MAKRRVVIFGAGTGGKQAYYHLKKDYNVIAFVDNDKMKQGSELFDVLVLAPSDLASLEYDDIYISCVHVKEITSQLNKCFKVPLEKIEWIGNHYCVICGHKIFSFFPYRGGAAALPLLMVSLKVIGSNVDHFGCPYCGSHDRERHLLMYLRSCGLFDKLSSMSILHFAPEVNLSQMILDIKPVLYIRCDLYSKAPDVACIDMLNIPYPDKVFDLVIANHVLEHVSDDLKGLQEIRRVLKAGGLAVLQTPFSEKLHHTWADPGIDNDELRRQIYGQEDHVRLYGKDIFSRFISAGFTSCVSQHEALLPNIDPAYYGINAAEPFFLFQRSEE